MKGILRTTVKIDLSELHKGDLQLGSQLPDVKVSELLAGARSRVIVFDDFERASMSSVEVLAYINPLVEHDGCKVIILANEEKITDKLDYEERKEKTVGQTLSVVPDVEAAFQAFLNEIDNAAASEFFLANRDVILQIFLDSTLGNLRLLKQFLWDFERLYTLLDHRYLQNAQGILQICKFLLVSTLELRSGQITLQEFGIPQISAFMKRRQAEKEGAELAVRQMDDLAKQYPTVDFSGELITFDTAVQMITKSVYDMAEIHRQLNAHPLFTPVGNLPSWRALWFSMEQPDNEIPSIVSRFERDFGAKRDYEEGEIPHIIGLGLWLADIGQSGWSGDDIEARLKRFIDEFYDARPVTASEAASSFIVDHSMSGGLGLQFKRHNDPRFRALCEYLDAKAISWREKCMPEASKHLQLMLQRGEVEEFSTEISLAPEGRRGLYVSVPVLRLIALDDFLAAFATLQPSGRRRIFKALNLRYDHIYVYRQLLDEGDWIVELKRRLFEHANSLAPIPADAMRQHTTFYLGHLPEKFTELRRLTDQEKTTAIAATASPLEAPRTADGISRRSD